MRAPAVLKQLFKIADGLVDAVIGKQPGSGIKPGTTDKAPAPGTDADGMAVELGGVAIAAGNNTLATGTLDNNLVDQGRVTTAWGSAEFSASATSNTGKAPGALAATTVDVAGADFAVILQSGWQASGAEFASAKSQTYYVAIDIEGWTPTGGQTTVLLTGSGGGHSLPPGAAQYLGKGHLDLGKGHLAKLSGNIAHVSATAVAEGGASFAGVGTEAIAIMDQFSLVQGGALTAIA